MDRSQTEKTPGQNVIMRIWLGVASKALIAPFKIEAFIQKRDFRNKEKENEYQQ